MKFFKIACISLFVFTAISVKAQLQIPSGISGDFQFDGQTYKADSLIGAPEVPEKFLSNGYLTLLYTNGNFNCGLRYESYANVLQGYDPRFRGSGIKYRFAEFNKDDLTVTAGSFYEQFGSGMILRTYVDYGLGYDNFFDGVRVKYAFKGIYLKGLVAKQRFFFEDPRGLVRGFDGEMHLNEMFKNFESKKTQIIIGGSFVSKYQKDSDPKLKLPENVAAGAGRINIIRGGLNVYAEYAQKINDPSYTNTYIYKNGQALYTTIGYTTKGLGINLATKYTDNMDYRSDRNATGNVQFINFLPPISKQYTYRMLTLYPYATQPNGEMGFMGEIYYTIKPGSKLGGKYGTFLSLNSSYMTSIKKDSTDDCNCYTAPFFVPGDNVYYNDIGFEISRKINKKWKVAADAVYILYNQAIIEGHPDSGTVYSMTFIGDVTYQMTKSKSIRMELQHLSANRDRGNWAFALLEFSVSPHWTLSAYDEYNYGNANPDRRFHYPAASLAYVKGTTRLSVGYAKQRAGLLCVGGVCRYVPASNGVTFGITSSF